MCFITRLTWMETQPRPSQLAVCPSVAEERKKTRKKLFLFWFAIKQARLNRNRIQCMRCCFVAISLRFRKAAPRGHALSLPCAPYLFFFGSSLPAPRLWLLLPGPARRDRLRNNETNQAECCFCRSLKIVFVIDWRAGNFPQSSDFFL